MKHKTVNRLTDHFIRVHKNTLLTLVIICELVYFAFAVPVIIKSTIKVDKFNTLYSRTRNNTSPNQILSKLKNAINAGNDFQNDDRNSVPFQFSERQSLHATPTTLKLKNAIRVLGYAGNKQIIPMAQQRQASAELPNGVVALDTIISKFSCICYVIEIQFIFFATYLSYSMFYQIQTYIMNSFGRNYNGRNYHGSTNDNKYRRQN